MAATETPDTPENCLNIVMSPMSAIELLEGVVEYIEGDTTGLEIDEVVNVKKDILQALALLREECVWKRIKSRTLHTGCGRNYWPHRNNKFCPL